MKAATVLVIHRSMWSEKVVGQELPITEAECAAWCDGLPAQDAFPQLETPEREFIMTGYTRGDWLAMYGRQNTTRTGNEPPICPECGCDLRQCVCPL